MNENPTRGATVVAAFPDREHARAALHALRRAGRRDAWLGVITGLPDAVFGGAAGADGTGGTRVEPDSDGALGAMARAFSDETATTTLYDVLRRRGVDDDTARRLETQLPEGTSVMTVAGDDAAHIVTANGGRIVAGAARASAGEAGEF